MKLFNDFTNHEIIGTKEDQITAIVDMLNNLHKNNKIKDIMLIVRTTDTEPGPKGLPQNIYNSITVDTEYEATVFARFATDILFNRMKEIAVKDFVNQIKQTENLIINGNSFKEPLGIFNEKKENKI